MAVNYAEASNRLRYLRQCGSHVDRVNQPRQTKDLPFFSNITQLDRVNKANHVK